MPNVTGGRCGWALNDFATSIKRKRNADRYRQSHTTLAAPGNSVHNDRLHLGRQYSPRDSNWKDSRR